VQQAHVAGPADIIEIAAGLRPNRPRQQPGSGGGAQKPKQRAAVRGVGALR